MRRTERSIATRPSLLSIALSLAAACGPSALPTGKGAPDFTGTTIDGSTFRLSRANAEGPVLLYFFTASSEASLPELPSLIALHEAHQKDGLRVVGVAMDGPLHMADVSAWAGRNRVPFPVVRDEDTRIATLYNPAKAPHLIVLVDRHGTVVRVREGWIAGDERVLARDVDRALRGVPID
jgi:peroxiredoxin